MCVNTHVETAKIDILLVGIGAKATKSLRIETKKKRTKRIYILNLKVLITKQNMVGGDKCGRDEI